MPQAVLAMNKALIILLSLIIFIVGCDAPEWANYYVTIKLPDDNTAYISFYCVSYEVDGNKVECVRGDGSTDVFYKKSRAMVQAISLSQKQDE